MRQLIAVALFCAGLFCIAQAQVPMTGAGLGAPSSGGFSPSCSQSSTFLAAATGYSLTADKTAVDTFICGGVTDGWFAKLDVLHLYAAPSTTNAALINLVNPGTFNGTAHGTVSFSAYAGYTGDASTFFIDTGFNPATAVSPKYALNSASFGYCGLTADTNSNQDIPIGMSDGASNSWARPGNTGNTVNWRLNSLSTANDLDNGTWTATWVFSTNSTTTTDYFNGTAGTANSITPTAVPSADFYVGAFNNNGSAGFNVNAQIAAAYIGQLLSSTDANNLHTRLNTYLTNYSHGGIC